MRKIILLIGVMIGIVIGIMIARFATISSQNKPLYGNDRVSIEKIIIENSLVTMPIEIVGIEDISNQRIVGFIENGIHLGVAHFTKNEEGNYIFNSMQIDKYKDFSTVFESVSEKGRLVDIGGAIINNVKIDRIEILANDHLIDEISVFKYPSMIVIPIRNASKDLKFEVKYYDYEGNFLVNE